MDATRSKELRASLERELKEESARQSFTQKDRIAWLSDRLAEYLDRWLGFCEISEATMPQLVNSVLFAAVEIGADVLREELRSDGSPPQIRKAWDRFDVAVTSMRSGGDKRRAMELRELLANWRAAIASPAA